MRTTKNKKHLLAILLVLVAVLALSFTLAACNSDEQPEQPKDPAKTTYTVTIAPYEATQGTVTLAPASADGKYEEGTIVTVTVSAKAGFEVQSFAVSTDQNAALDNDGKYKLTVSANTTITATFKSTNVAVTSVTVSPAQSSLEVGRDDDQNKTVQLTAEVLPANATNKAVTWTSEDPTIATVSETGIVTAIAEGSATIKATAGGIEGTATITVSTHSHAAAAEAEWQNEDGKHYKLCACGRHVDEDICAAAPEASWEVDDENDQHYHECAICGDHIDVTNCSADGDEWTTNADEHYQECKDCYQQINKANHTWGKPQPTEDGTQHQIGCTECTYKQEAVDHVRPEVVTEATPVVGTTKRHSFKCAECDGMITENCASKSGTTIHLENIGVKESENGKHVLYCKLCGNLSAKTSDQHTWSNSSNKYTPGEDGHHTIRCSKSMSWYNSSSVFIGSMSCTMEQDGICAAASTKKYVASAVEPNMHCEQCDKCKAPIESTKEEHTSAEVKKYIPYGENNAQHIEQCSICGVGFGDPSDHSRDANGHCVCGDCTHLKLATVHSDYIDGTCAGCGKQVLFYAISASGSYWPSLIEGAEAKYLSSLDVIKLEIPRLLPLESGSTVKINSGASLLTSMNNSVPFSAEANAKIQGLYLHRSLNNLAGFTALKTVYVQADDSDWVNMRLQSSTVETIVYSGSFKISSGTNFASQLLYTYMADANENLKIFLPLDITTYKNNLSSINALSGTSLTSWNALKSHLYFKCATGYFKTDFEGLGDGYAFDDSGSDVVLGDFCKIKIMTDDDELKAKEATYTVGIAWRNGMTGIIKSTEVHFTAGDSLTKTVTITLSYEDLTADTSWPNIQLFAQGGDLQDTVYYENKTDPACKYSGAKWASASSSGRWCGANGGLWYEGTANSDAGSWTFTLTVQCDGNILECVIDVPKAD